MPDAGDYLAAAQQENGRLKQQLAGMENILEMARIQSTEYAELKTQFAAVKEIITRSLEASEDEDSVPLSMADFGSLLRVVFSNDIPALIAKAIRSPSAN